MNPALEAVGRARKARMSERQGKKCKCQARTLEAAEAGAPGVGSCVGGHAEFFLPRRPTEPPGAWTSWFWALSYSGRPAGQAGQV